MADVELTYKGNKIVELSASGSKTLKTSGKYCEGDISLVYTKSGGAARPYITIPSDFSGYPNQVGAYLESLNIQGLGSKAYIVLAGARTYESQLTVASFLSGECKTVARWYSNSTSINTLPTSQTATNTLYVYAGDKYEIFNFD